jgi:LPS-assembly lipoprotein
MWSCKPTRRRVLQVAVSAGLLAPLAACGFRPLYGNASTASTATRETVNQQMAAVRLEPIANRLGQQLHNALRDRFNPLGQPAQSRYSLEVNLTQRIYGALAKRDLSASRRNVETTAFFVLRDSNGTAVLTDQSQTTTGYDEFDDPLNDISALADAERRGTEQLADMISTRVAVFLTGGTQPAPAPVPAAAVPTP